MSIVRLAYISLNTTRFPMEGWQQIWENNSKLSKETWNYNLLFGIIWNFQFVIKNKISYPYFFYKWGSVYLFLSLIDWELVLLLLTACIQMERIIPKMQKENEKNGGHQFLFAMLYGTILIIMWGRCKLDCSLRNEMETTYMKVLAK